MGNVVTSRRGSCLSSSYSRLDANANPEKFEHGEVVVAEDWSAVAQVINGRMKATALTQARLAQSSNVALATVRELTEGKERRWHPRTLYLDNILWDNSEDVVATQLSEEVVNDLQDIKRNLSTLIERLDAIENIFAANEFGAESAIKANRLVYLAG